MSEELKIKIGADAKGAKKEIGATQKALQAMGNTAKATGQVMASAMKAVASAVKVAATAATAAGVALVGVAKSTEEFRVNQAKLNAAFVASGKSADNASAVYKNLFKVIGQSDEAVEAAQQIALFTASEEEAIRMSKIASGVIGSFGDALKSETFFEAANETLKLNEATGAYTQMLEGTGYSVEAFNAQLQKLNTEEERRNFILSVAEQQMGAAGAAYDAATKAIQEQRLAQAELDESMAVLGNIVTPLVTSLLNLANVFITALTPAIAAVLPYIIAFVDKISQAVQWVAKFMGVSSDSSMGSGFAAAANNAQKVTNSSKGAAKGIDKTKEAAEKLKRSTAGFDELNIMSSGSSGSSSSSDSGAGAAGGVGGLSGGGIDMAAAMGAAEIPDFDITGIGDKVLALVNEIIPKALSALGAFLPKVITVITEILLAVIELIRIHAPQLIQIIADTLPLLIESLLAIGLSIVQTIVELLPLVTGALLGILPQLLEALLTMTTAIIEGIATMLPIVVEQIVTVVPLLIEAFINALPELLDAAVTLLMAVVEAIPVIIPLLTKELPKIITSVLDALIKALPDVLKAAITLLLAVVNAIPQIIPPLVEALPTIIEQICTVLDENLPIILDGAIALLMAIVYAIPEILPSLVNAIPDIIDTLVETIIGAIPTLIVAAVKLFFALVDAIPQILPALILAILTLINDLLESVDKAFIELGVAIGESIGGAIKEAINWIISKVVKTINTFIKGINWALDIINAIPGVSIKKITELTVPKFAKGGIVNSATLGIIGEAGKEAVVPLENNTEWIDKLADRLNKGKPSKIVLMLDGRELGWAAIDNINDITEQTGSLQLVMA